MADNAWLRGMDVTVVLDWPWILSQAPAPSLAENFPTALHQCYPITIKCQGLPCSFRRTNCTVV